MRLSTILQQTQRLKNQKHLNYHLYRFTHLYHPELVSGSIFYFMDYETSSE